MGKISIDRPVPSDDSDSLPPYALRAEALESLLVEKKLLPEDAVDKIIELYVERVGPKNGAKVVARAWVDPKFKKRLLENGQRAIEEFNFEGRHTEKLDVLENTEKIHNAVVCTLCSCYPWAVLGLPPKWYKDPKYRSRMVREPRKLLTEMGLVLEDDIEIRVWDSSSEIRYLVLPERPKNTEGLSEEELAELVTRDSMIGVAHIDPPQ